MREAGLALHPEKTRIVDATQRGGFDFLGWHFEGGYQWPRAKSQTKLKEGIRALTPRNSGKSLREIVFRLNRTLKGWRAYFDHGVRNAHEDIDGMVRRRLRQLMHLPTTDVLGTRLSSCGRGIRSKQLLMSASTIHV